MGKKAYGQLSLTERIEIYRLHADGKSCRFIANALGRAASTISRELRRNARATRKWPGGYDPQRAQSLMARRHARGRSYKLERQPELRKLVIDQLAMGRSPEQIAGRLTLDHGRPVISHESIYRYIYWRAGFKERLYRLLPCRKHRRGNHRDRLPRRSIPARVPIHDRPQTVAARTRFGHWEADLMNFSKPDKAVLVVCERKSRWLFLRELDNKTSDTVIGNLDGMIKTLPQGKCHSITFDNGPEFTKHHILTTMHRIKTWFCDPRSPWQKGSVENAIGRLRRVLPRKTPPERLSSSQISEIVHTYNTTPRKCLGFKTPQEVFFALNPTVALQT